MNPISQFSLAVTMSRPLWLAAQALREQLRSLWHDALRQHEQRRAMHELQRLDAQTWRDLGLHECEASSVAAEVVGLAEPTRRRLAPRPRHLRDDARR